MNTNDTMMIECKAGVQRSKALHKLLPTVWDFQDCRIYSSTYNRTVMIEVPKSKMFLTIRAEDIMNAMKASSKRLEEINIKKKWEDLKK